MAENILVEDLSQLTGKANYQRYGKLAGLIKEDLVDPELNPIWC